MLSIRRAAERGHANHGWLDTHHTFSFADYYDPSHVGFRSLRVINDDTVSPGRGFGKHGHRDMEIISYVLEGELAHEDSMGTGSVIRPGDVQRMSAGTGVLHSEFNHSKTDPVHFLQIWIIPSKRDIEPSYSQKRFDDNRGKLCLIASRDGRNGSISIEADADIYSAVLAGERIEHEIKEGRAVWVHVARGSVKVNGEELQTGDGASTENDRTLAIEGDGEVLLFDLS